MNNQELKERLSEIRSGMKFYDNIIDTTDAILTNADVDEPDTVKLSLRQAKVVEKLLDLFNELNWQIALNNHKEIQYNNTEVIQDNTFTGAKTGDAVKVRPVGDEYDGKTFFGIMIGNVATSIRHSISGEVMTAEFSQRNPAILIPELNKIVYGYQSWWGKVDEDGFDDVITDETISNVWYVKALKNLTENEMSDALKKVYVVHQGDDDCSSGTPVWFYDSRTKAETIAEGRGWWGGDAPVSEQLLVEGKDGKFYHVSKANSVTLNPDIDKSLKKAELRDKALSKLSDEEKDALDLK